MMLLHLMSPQGALPAEADQIIKHSNRKHQALQSAGAKGRQATIAQKGGDKNSDEPDLGQVLHGHGRRRGAEEPLQIPSLIHRYINSSCLSGIHFFGWLYSNSSWYFNGWMSVGVSYAQLE